MCVCVDGVGVGVGGNVAINFIIKSQNMFFSFVVIFLFTVYYLVQSIEEKPKNDQVWCFILY